MLRRSRVPVDDVAASARLDVALGRAPLAPGAGWSVDGAAGAWPEPPRVAQPLPDPAAGAWAEAPLVPQPVPGPAAGAWPEPAVGLPSALEAERVPAAAVAAAARDLVPPAVRGARVAVTRRAAAALAVVGVVAAAVTAAVLWDGRPVELPVASVVEAPGAEPSAAAPATAEVVVSVAGAVRRPGLVRLPAGARVDDALRAAGGLRPGASVGTLNLARRLADGEQVLVGAPPGGAPAGGGAPVAPDAKLDLNTATVDQLDDLPGVGPVLAERIVAWRTKHGRFTSVAQLREVSGIGESKYQQLKGEVVV